MRRRKKATKKALEEIAELQAQLYRRRGRRSDKKIRLEALQVAIAAIKLVLEI